MTKNNIHCQNLAYCRYLHIWCLLYFLNIVNFTPLISLIIVSVLHLYSLELTSKRIGILLSDIFLILIIFNLNNKLYFEINIFIFLLYIIFLLIIKINPIKLYTVYLKNDDLDEMEVLVSSLESEIQKIKTN